VAQSSLLTKEISITLIQWVHWECY